MGTAPVTDDDTIVAPILFQNLVQENIIVTIVLVLIEIIGAHDAPRSTLLYCCLESRQVDFVQGTVAHLYIHVKTELLVVVQRVVLHTSSNTLRLHTLNIGNYHT